MYVTITPNIEEELRRDPVVAMAVELLRREKRPGYLHLSRSTTEAPFHALFYEPDGTRHEMTAPDLSGAILGALE